MIVEECLPSPHGDRSQLECLRQVHHHFRDLRFIQSWLFRSIKFYIEPEELHDLNDSLTRIGPFIQSITVEHNWALADTKPKSVSHQEELKATAAQIDAAVRDGTLQAVLIKMVRKMPNLCRVHLDDGRRRSSTWKSEADDDKFCVWIHDLGPFNETILSIGMACIAANFQPSRNRSSSRCGESPH